MGAPKKLYSDAGLTKEQIQIRELAMSDLKAFVRLIAPQVMLGHCHLDLLDFFNEKDEYQLVLWPRAHQKSRMIAFWVLWWLVKHPHAHYTFYPQTPLDSLKVSFSS